NFTDYFVKKQICSSSLFLLDQKDLVSLVLEITKERAIFVPLSQRVGLVFLGENHLSHPGSPRLTPTHPKIARAQGGITPGPIKGELAVKLPSLGGMGGNGMECRINRDGTEYPYKW